jgi:hypothetical protein
MGFLPEFSLGLTVRYLVRILLFPIMPYFLVPYYVYLGLAWVARWLMGYSQRSDANSKGPEKFKPRFPRKSIPYICSFQSFYFTTKDGTRLAVDIWLPPGARSKPVSVIFHQARYYRSARMAMPIHNLRANKPYNLISQEYFEVSSIASAPVQWSRFGCGSEA